MTADFARTQSRELYAYFETLITQDAPGAKVGLDVDPGIAPEKNNDLGYLTLAEVAKLLPGRTKGERVSVDTLWRWCQRGLRGLKLKSVLVGGTRCTTLPWLQEFIEARNQSAQTGAHEPPRVRTQNQRQTASEQAAEELRKQWRKPPQS